jgi:hypothetical protein
MAKSGLRKVMKSVRGKHGTVRRAYYMKSAAPAQASRGKRALGAIVGGMVGAGVGALFGAAGGAAAGGVHANSVIRRDAHGWAGVNQSAGNIHPSVSRGIVSQYMAQNPKAMAAHMARGTAGGAAVFGTGGAIAGGAFGAALGYAAANRLGRGGRAGRSR